MEGSEAEWRKQSRAGWRDGLRRLRRVISPSFWRFKLWQWRARRKSREEDPFIYPMW